MQSFNPSKDWKCNPSKGWRNVCNLSTLQRITNTILQTFKGLQMQSFKDEGVSLKSFEGLYGCLWSLEGFNDYMWDWMWSYEELQDFNPFEILWMVERIHRILRRVGRLHDPSTLDGSQMKSFKVKWSPSQYFKGLKDCICNQSKGWRIESKIVRNPSKGWKTTLIFQSFNKFEELCAIPGGRMI